MNADVMSCVGTSAPTDIPVSRAVVMVVHQAPAYRHGVSAGLIGAGFSVREAPSLEDADGHWDVCLLAVGCAGEREALAAARYGVTPTVALLPSPVPTDYQMALRYGAAGAVAQDAPVRQIVEVIDAALHGTTVLPVEVARELAQGPVSIPEALELSGQVAEWLRALSEGVPISTIARNAGYSERQMYRRMQQLYRRIGARNRGEAICIAAQWGIGPNRPTFPAKDLFRNERL